MSLLRLLHLKTLSPGGVFFTGDIEIAGGGDDEDQGSTKVKGRHNLPVYSVQH